MTVNKKLVELLGLEEAQIMTCFVLVGHGHLQYGECDCLASNLMRFHMYMIVAIFYLKDAVAVAYHAAFSTQNFCSTLKNEEEKPDSGRANYGDTFYKLKKQKAFTAESTGSTDAAH